MEVIGKLTLLIGGMTLALGCGAAFPQNMGAQQNPQQSSQPVSPQNSQQDAQKSSQQTPLPKENLAAMKQRMTERIQARIKEMQKSLDCIKNAQEEGALRVCGKEARNRGQAGAGMMRRGMGGYE